MRAWTIPLAAVLTFGPASLVARPTELPLEWIPITGAFSYQVLITKDGNVVRTDTVATNRLNISLEPGQYVLRIAVINRFRKIASWSDPAPLMVGDRPPIPIVREATLKNGPGKDSKELQLRGENLGADTQVTVSSETAGTIPVTAVRQTSGDSAVAELDTHNAKPGDYDLTVRNPLFAPQTTKGAVKITGEDTTTAVHSQPASCQDTFGALWRSALLPGWGHWCLTDRKTALGYGALFVGSVAIAASANAVARERTESHSRNATRDVWITTVTGHRELPVLSYLFLQAAQRYEAAQSSRRKANRYARIVGSVYAIQLAHAGIAGYRFKLRAGRQTAYSFSILPEGCNCNVRSAYGHLRYDVRMEVTY